MKKLLIVSCFTVFVALFVFIGFVSAVDRGCNITSFTMSPSGPNYNLGDIIHLDGRSNCGTVKFEIDGQSRSEIGSTNQTMDLNTSEWGPGGHQVCFVARGEGGWENADRRCNSINVTGTPTQPPQPTPVTRGCNITSFTMSPSGPNYSLGTVIFLDGRSNCGTVKFEIDGQSRSEIGSTNQTMNLNTSEWGVGSHQVCFVARGNGGWEMADRRCNTINVSTSPTQPPQPTQPPAGRGCNITSFTMSPAGPNYPLGTIIYLDGRSNCGTVKFEIDGQSRSEIGSTNQTMNLNTSEWGNGNHSVCFVARGNGGWEMADRRCNTINVTTTPTQPPAGRGCDITSFTMSPIGPNYKLGDTIYLDGRSNCGTVKFEIDGQSRSEIGSTNQTMNLNTSEWGVGNHSVCFVARGNGGWENADRECKTIQIGITPTATSENPSDIVLPPDLLSTVCFIDSFDIYPIKTQPGASIKFLGAGHCNGNTLRAIRFSINGEPYGEFAGASTSVDWNTNGFSQGTYIIGFHVAAYGDPNWENQAARYAIVTLGSESSSGDSQSSSSSPSSSTCHIQDFGVYPQTGPAGTQITINGRSSCNAASHSQFVINEDVLVEFKSAEKTFTLDTTGWQEGWYAIGFQASTEDWWLGDDEYIFIHITSHTNSANQNCEGLWGSIKCFVAPPAQASGFQGLVEPTKPQLENCSWWNLICRWNNYSKSTQYEQALKAYYDAKANAPSNSPSPSSGGTNSSQSSPSPVNPSLASVQEWLSKWELEENKKYDNGACAKLGNLMSGVSFGGGAQQYIDKNKSDPKTIQTLSDRVAAKMSPDSCDVLLFPAGGAGNFDATYGHVGVVYQSTESGIWFVEQNRPTGTGVSLSFLNYNDPVISGAWIRPANCTK